MRQAARHILVVIMLAGATAVASASSAEAAPAVCGNGPLSGSSTLVTSDHQTHKYYFRIPSTAAPAGGRPVLIWMHGDGGTGAPPFGSEFWQYTDPDGAILLTPNGTDLTWTHAASDLSGQPQDSQFISLILDELQLATCAGVDKNHIYLGGASRGAFMPYFLLQRPSTRNRIAAVAVNAGLLYCQTGDTACQAESSDPVLHGAHVPILHLHGTDDTLVEPPPTATYAGNPNWDVDWRVFTPMKLWAQQSGCFDYTSYASGPNNGVLRETYSVNGHTARVYDLSGHGADCSKYQLILVDNGGHVIPNQEERIWNFLQGNHPPQSIPASAAGAFTPVSPARLLDTRNGTGTSGAIAKVPSSGSVSVQVSGKGGVPSSGVGAVVLNVTATNPTVSGFVTAYPTGATKPNASNLNFNAGQTIPNHVTVKLGTGGKVTLFNGSGGSVDLIADVAGWYVTGDGTANGTFTALNAPVRLLDTREPIGVGIPKAKIASGATLPFLVAGAVGSGVPASNVGAGVLNVTVTNTAGSGFLTAFPNGTTPPTASNLNFNAGNTIANAATVKLGSDGKVALYNGSNGSLDAVADIAGWFNDGAATVSGAFTPLAPARLLDTRTGLGAVKAKIPSGGSVTLDVANHGGVPASGAGAAVLNVTVTNTAGGGFVTAYPAGTNKPNASNLNFNPGTTIPNLVTVKLGTGTKAGKVTFYNGSGGPLDLIADVAGWYKN
jgi:poly(3-hydroxybutyrate) depolymerase